MKLNKKIIKSITVMLLLTVFNFVVPTYYYEANANTQSNSEIVEAMLKEIINEYGEDNIIFDDGIVLEESEEISLADLSNELPINWESRDNSVVEVTNDEVKAISYGTTFLIGEENGKYHVRQVYVSVSEMKARSAVSTYNVASTRKSQYVVYLDPGHGGTDPGASGNGIIEKNLNLTIALGVRNKLESMGIKVYMSRDTDTFVSLQDIAAGANSVNPDVFVSIHQNSFSNTSANGIETYWYNNNNSKELATYLQDKLIANTNANNRGVKKEEFYVIKNTSMPSSLVECGFITNAAEATNLKSTSYQNKIIDAIANGIQDYLKANITLNSLTAERIYGNNRYETSYEVLNKGWSNSEYAVLASGVDYPDALCATPLASKYNAPILLVNNTSLSNQPKLLSSLKSKGVSKVFIIGGTTAISSEIESGIKDAGITVTRVGGKDRYETSVKIAQLVGSTSGEIAVANGLEFADGLSISSVAAMKNMPILLTSSNELPKVVSDYINKLTLNKTFVIGKEAAVSSNVSNKLKNVERLGGANRYETNRSIFNRFKSNISLDNLYIASGVDFPDALSVSALAGKNSNFVLLSNTNYSEPSIKETISSVKQNIGDLYVLGGQLAIPDSIIRGLGIDYIR